MPIARELRHFYRTESYRAFLAALKARAGGRCEWCEKPGGRVDTRTGYEWVIVNGRKKKLRRMFWKDPNSLVWWNEQGNRPSQHEYELALSFPLRHITATLCAAHLNHQAGDDRPENGALLCNWCHLNQDQPHHKATRSTKKDAKRPLVQEVAS